MQKSIGPQRLAVHRSEFTFQIWLAGRSWTPRSLFYRVLSLSTRQAVFSQDHLKFWRQLTCTGSANSFGFSTFLWTDSGCRFSSFWCCPRQWLFHLISVRVSNGEIIIWQLNALLNLVDNSCYYKRDSILFSSNSGSAYGKLDFFCTD